MEIKEFSPVCQKLSEGINQPLLVGISINNSYFKDENLAELLSWAFFNGPRTKVMIPDEPMIDTFMALGYSKEKATQKARLKANALENKCWNIIGRRGYDCIQTIRWRNIISNKYYINTLLNIEIAYRSDLLFQQAVRNGTKEVLVSNGCPEPKVESIEIGTGFLLKELAFVSCANWIFHEETMAYVYHKRTTILKEIIEKKYQFLPSPAMGYVVVA